MFVGDIFLEIEEACCSSGAVLGWDMYVCMIGQTFDRV